MGPFMKDFGIDRLTPEERVNLALEIWERLGDDRPVGRLLDLRCRLLAVLRVRMFGHRGSV